MPPIVKDALTITEVKKFWALFCSICTGVAVVVGGWYHQQQQLTDINQKLTMLVTASANKVSAQELQDVLAGSVMACPSVQSMPPKERDQLAEYNRQLVIATHTKYTAANAASVNNN